MINIAKFTTILGLVLITTIALAAGEHKHRGSYEIIDPAVPRVVENDAEHEVIELFWYGCSHCFDFEPHVKQWKQNKSHNVSFVRVPAIFNARWEQHARAFYALELMGELEKGHDLLFSGIHEQGRSLNDLDSMARYFAANDIDAAKFRESFNSFVVETKINRAKQLIRQYQVTGVPAIIIDGKYRLSASQAGGYTQLIAEIDALTAEY